MARYSSVFVIRIDGPESIVLKCRDVYLPQYPYLKSKIFGNYSEISFKVDATKTEDVLELSQKLTREQRDSLITVSLAQEYDGYTEWFNHLYYQGEPVLERIYESEWRYV